MKKGLVWEKMGNFIRNLAQGGRDSAFPLQKTANSRMSIK